MSDRWRFVWDRTGYVAVGVMLFGGPWWLSAAAAAALGIMLYLDTLQQPPPRDLERTTEALQASLLTAQALTRMMTYPPHPDMPDEDVAYIVDRIYRANMVSTAGLMADDLIEPEVPDER